MALAPPPFRFRLTYAVGGAMRYASVLDMGRLWERLLRRADLGLVYSRGFTPHPGLFLADALPVGYASECELVDVFLREWIAEGALLDRVTRECPLGLDVRSVQAVPIDAPKPQALMRAAGYRVSVTSARTSAEVQAAIDSVLALVVLPRVRRRGTAEIAYDLRPLVYDVALVSSEGEAHVLTMTLRCGSQGAGRPEEVVAALGLDARRLDVCRTHLLWQPKEDGP